MSTMRRNFSFASLELSQRQALVTRFIVSIGVLEQQTAPMLKSEVQVIGSGKHSSQHEHE